MNHPLIEYRRIGLHPTCIGNERIRLEADGRLYWAKNSRECDEGQLWSEPWHCRGRVGAESLAAMVRVIHDSGIAHLPALISDPDVEGGKREELALCLNGVSHDHILENAIHPAFAAVVRHLRGLLAQVAAA